MNAEKRNRLSYALTKDGSDQFKKFLGQLDASYMNLLGNGRSVNIKFELGTTCKVSPDDRVDSVRLSDRVEECIQKIALHGKYSVSGVNAEYMDCVVQVPIVDENGAFITPSRYLGRPVDNYFFSHGFTVTELQVNYGLNFILRQKPDRPKS